MNQQGPIRTFLIADVRGYTSFTVQHGDESALRLAGDFARIARETVADHEGQVIELRGDEALAVFSSARAALRAAADLQRRVAGGDGEASLPLPIGIGLDAGEAIPFEDGYRGAALNLAARLCSLAGAGEILASETVTNLARRLEDLEYADRGMVELKGFSEPVRVMEVRSPDAVPVTSRASGRAGEAIASTAPAQLGTDAATVVTSGDGGARHQQLPIGGFLGALPATPIVAREGELAQAMESIEAVQRGEGRLVLLAGEPGAGKTRLAQEITLEVRNRGYLIAAGRCYEAEGSVPYYPFLDALAMLFAAVSQELRADARAHLPYLGVLLPEQIGSPEAVGGQDEQQRVFRATATFVEAAAREAPVAMLLDDLHWADSASLKLVLFLAHAVRPARVLLVGAYRDVEVSRQGPLEDALRELSREGLAERVAVRRLETEGTRALIASEMGEEEISEEFAALIQGRTEGNAFFVQQVLRVLVERGDITRKDGRWDRKRLEEIEVPESVRSVIGQRLSRLAEETQEILREASVLGQSFEFDDLLAMSGRDEAAIEGAIEEASSIGLVRHERGDRYAFDHALTQGALYGELTPRRRRRLHLAAGTMLANLPERKREERVPEIAWHLLQGDDPEAALFWCLRAGDAAEASFAHTEAEWQYRTALELAREIGDRAREAEALAKIGRAVMDQSRYDETLPLLEEAATLTRGLEDPEGEARIVAAIGWAHRFRGTPAEGIARLEPVLRDRQGDTPTQALLDLYLSLATLHFVAGDHEAELKAAEHAGEIARTLGNERALAMAEVRRGTALPQLKRRDEGMAVLADAIELADRAGEPFALSLALNNLSSELTVQGDFARAIVLQRRNVQVTERMSNPAGLVFALSELAYSLIFVGEWGEARALLERADAIERSIEEGWHTSYLLVADGLLALLDGRREHGERRVEQALALAQRNGDPQAARYAQVMLLYPAMLENRPDGVRRHLDALREQRTEPSRMWFPHAIEAWLLDLEGDEPGAQEALARAEEVDRQMDNLWVTYLTQLAAGIIRTRHGRWEGAADDLDAALRKVRMVGVPLEEGVVLLRLGELETARGNAASARERLEGALAIFRRLGAAPFVASAERALRELPAPLTGA